MYRTKDRKHFKKTLHGSYQLFAAGGMNPWKLLSDLPEIEKRKEKTKIKH